uniref:Uncharacterized protein n=1 Tax=Physcomitrium patens TaxID=3218 RepID=A0A2K1KKJ2_PHYPA|nr:hypothetical protein PHYPA_007966 [Physcomitrium patens]
MLMRATASLLPLLELRSFCRCCPKTLKMSNAGGAGSGLVLETSNTTCKNRMNRGLFFVYCCISWCSVFPCITSCLHITVGMRVLMGASTEVLPSHTTEPMRHPPTVMIDLATLCLLQPISIRLYHYFKGCLNFPPFH